MFIREKFFYFFYFSSAVSDVVSIFALLSDQIIAVRYLVFAFNVMHKKQAFAFIWAESEWGTGICVCMGKCDLIICSEFVIPLFLVRIMCAYLWSLPFSLTKERGFLVFVIPYMQNASHSFMWVAVFSWQLGLREWNIRCWKLLELDGESLSFESYYAGVLCFEVDKSFIRAASKTYLSRAEVIAKNCISISL